MPPHNLMPDLAADLVALQDAITRNKEAAFHRDLYSACATLAAIMGMTANALGLPRESRNWWRSARHCAEVSDNRDLKVGYRDTNQ